MSVAVAAVPRRAARVNRPVFSAVRLAAAVTNNARSKNRRYRSPGPGRYTTGPISHGVAADRPRTVHPLTRSGVLLIGARTESPIDAAAGESQRFVSLADHYSSWRRAGAGKGGEKLYESPL